MEHFLKNTDVSVVPIDCKGAFYHGLLYCYRFLSIVLHESGTRKSIFLSLSVYSKIVCSQCNLTVQIDRVQCNIYFQTKTMIGKNIVDLNVLFCDVILMLSCQTLDKHTIALLKMDFSSNAKFRFRCDIISKKSDCFTYYILRIEI